MNGRTTGRLYGVGVGPGDPELTTVKAARPIGPADVIAYHSARHGNSIARSIAAPHLREGQIEEPLLYPVTTETTDHPGGYRGALDDFYADCAARLAEHLDAGRTVVVLSEGDPLFYGSYMHLHKRLAPHYPAEVVPGVTSLSAAAAAAGRPLAEGDEVLTVLPGTLPGDELAERLRGADAAAVLKLGRTFTKVRQAFEDAGRLGDASYVERASADRQRVAPLAGVDPAGRPWLTPEAQDALASATDLVGYGPYLDRVPANARQRRHPSGNRVEAERARHALRLARDGARVAVVSSGDPGVFAMAAAVL